MENKTTIPPALAPSFSRPRVSRREASRGEADQPLADKKTPWAVFALFLFLLIASPLIWNHCLAVDSPSNAAINGLINTAQQAKIETGSAPNIYQIVGYIINVILGFLGVIFLVLVIYGGFLWMTAGGNEEKVKKGAELLTHAAIGLAIVLAAFLLTNFVVFKIFQGVQPA